MNATQDTPAESSPRRSRVGLVMGAVAAVLLVLIVIHIVTRKPPAKGTPPQVVKVAKRSAATCRKS